MARKNKYYRRSRLSEEVFEEILVSFTEDLTARQTERLTGVSIRSVNDIFIKLRRLIAYHCELDWKSQMIDNRDEIKVTRRAFERCCKIEGHKIIVLVLNEYRNRIFLEIAEDARKNEKSSAAKSRAGQFMTGFALQEQRNEFWAFLKNRLQKFRGIADRTFYLHVKETEFRFNHRERLLDKLKLMLEQNPL